LLAEVIASWSLGCEYIGPDPYIICNIHDNNIMCTRETRISCNKITTYAGIININNNDYK